MRTLFPLLLLGSFAFAQTPSNPSQAAAPKASPPTSQTAVESSSVPANAAVITIPGFCPSKQATGTECKTEVTRAQFDRLVDALHIPDYRKPELANAYAQMLVLGETAEKRGIANTPENEEVLKFVRLQTLAQMLARNLREEASNVPQADVQKYYDEHKEQFAQATLQRIFIPKAAPNGKDKPTEETFKAEAAKIDAAAKSPSADFAKLQKQAYDDLKITTAAPPVELQDMRRDSLPPAQQQTVFNLAPGAVSEPIDEPAAIYIYKLVSKDVQPLAQVEAEVKRNLEQERFRTEMETILGSSKPQLNQAYFAAAENSRPEPPRIPAAPPVTVTPGSSPASKVPAPAPKSSSNPSKPK